MKQQAEIYQIRLRFSHSRNNYLGHGFYLLSQVYKKIYNKGTYISSHYPYNNPILPPFFTPLLHPKQGMRSPSILNSHLSHFPLVVQCRFVRKISNIGGHRISFVVITLTHSYVFLK